MVLGSIVRVYLVRHGEVENPQRVRYGRAKGFPLSAVGRETALRTGRRLAAKTPPPAAVFTSPLDRAVETARAIASETGLAAPRMEPRLIEIATPFEGLPRTFAPWSYARRLFDARAFAGSEMPYRAALRMIEAIDHLRTEAAREGAKAIVLVSHQVPIQVARLALVIRARGAGTVGIAIGVQWGFMIRPRCACGSVTSADFDARGELRAIEYEEA